MARKRRFFRTVSRRPPRRELSQRGAARAVWVRRERRPPGAFWSDRERRRALLLSALLHAAVLLGVVWVSTMPEQETPEELVVLELAPPQRGAQELAAASGEPALPGPGAQVAGNASEDATVEDATVRVTPPRVTDAETPAPPETAQAEPLPPSESPPQARTPGQAAAQPPELPAQAPASTLPEIETVEVAPQPLEDALALPTPDPEASVTPSRRVAVAPQVAVSASRAVPTPEVAAVVATQEIALPRVQAEVAAEDAIPRPDVSAEVVSRAVPEPQVDAVVAQAQPVPQPDVQAEVASAVPQPQVGVVVAAARAVPQPDVAAEVTSRDVPEPEVGAVVTEAQAVPRPLASGSVVAGRNVPQPRVGAVVAESQPLAVTPGVALTGAVSIVTPNASVTVTPQLVQAEAEAGAEGETAADAGDGPRDAQADADATAAGQGAASDGGSAQDAGVANVQSFEATVERPLAVLIDNADDAYPQQGLVEASSVFEMPVEGGLTRLMSVYTRADPAQVGPIRSARDYFVEAALSMNGTLVHVGGAPSAVNRIASLEAEGFRTVDALEQSTLFAQAPDRSAPHSTFSTGTTLRDAVGSLENRVSGTLYTPPADAEDVSSLTVDYSADYTSGFYYLSDLDQYRWVRSGADAVDTAGSAVAADAVVVARVVAFPYSDDPEGRLYLPYSGGEATLYLRGKAIPGTWTPEGGFSFLTQTGLEVDLTPFKHWILFAPEAAQVTVQ